MEANERPGAELNVALNHLLLLTDQDPGEAFRIVGLLPSDGAVLELGDGTRWGCHVYAMPATAGL